MGRSINDRMSYRNHYMWSGEATSYVLFREAEAAKPDHVYMDAMGFGMGLCCLQLTFQVTELS